MVKGAIPSVQTWEERQGLSPPRHLSHPSSGLKRSRPVTSPASRSPPEVNRLLGQPEREVIIEDRAETRQQRPAHQPPPPPPPVKDAPFGGLDIYSTPTLAKLAQSRQTKQPPNTSPTKRLVEGRPLANGHHLQHHGGSTGTASESSSGTVSPKRVDGVETESLDSFTLEHPSAETPKPPPTYFDASRKKEVMVSIGAYGDHKPAPSRLQFLGDRKTDQDECDGGKFERVTVQLQQELVQTLSRSNLRHRTGSVDNLLSAADGGAAQRTVLDKYGSVLNVSDTSADCGPGGGILKNGQ